MTRGEIGDPIEDEHGICTPDEPCSKCEALEDNELSN